MGLMRKIIPLMAKKKMKHARYVIANPVETMDEKLMSMLQYQQDTVIGKKYDYSTITSPEEYAERVPISDFKSMLPYLEKVYERPDAGILTADPVMWYCQTSGTTGKPKNLPVTKSGMADYSKGSTLQQMAFTHYNKENAAVFDGNFIMFGAPAEFDHIAGIPVGYMTGIVAQKGTSKLLSRIVRPGPEIYNITDMDEKMLAYAELTCKVDPTIMVGITTLMLAFYRRMQNEYGPWLKDVMKGHEKEEQFLNALNDDGTLNLEKLWPNLKQMLITGIDTAPYREWINGILPNTTLWEAYAGSEGFYACNLFPDAGLHILPHINYLEFIPESETEKEHPKVIPLSELKKNSRYEIVLTNLNGWYRYRVGDMLTVTGTEPYTVASIGRKGRVVNLSGEKLSDAHVTNAIAYASAKTGVEVEDYTVVGEVKDGLPRYVIAALFNNDGVDAVEFVNAFEDNIRANNEEFRIVRDMKALGATVLMKMKSSHHEALVKATHIQRKPVPISTDTRILEMCEA